jgi:guanidinopropionase
MTPLAPADAALVPRFAGFPSFMRLAVLDDPSQVDVALVGVPFDGGTTNRPGARHGPREIRNQSSLIRRINANGVVPYDTLRVADLGDSPVNPFDIADSLSKIESFFRGLRAGGAIPLAAGGDHLITLPILRALADRPLGLIHFDSHSDTGDAYFGENRYTHGTPFRRAIEENLLDPHRCVQIAIRGTYYQSTDFDFARAVGIRIITMEEIMERGIKPVMAETREIIGDRPCYVSFDIDSLDPAFAPGTGTPEIGGLTTREAQIMLRALYGCQIIGADVVEVSPPFDPSGLTAFTGAAIMFELLCAIAQGKGAGFATPRSGPEP